MIERNILTRVMAEALQTTLPESISRDIEIKATPNKIITIAGIRRSGKTYELFNKMKELLAGGVKRGNMLYLNFEDERLRGMETKDMDGIIDIYKELSNPDEKEAIHLFFDEIQNVSGWEMWIRRLHETGYHIFITGSSSKLLSKEISTHLAGRSLTYLVYPFSFGEFLRAKGAKFGKQEVYANPGKFNKMLSQYMEFGAFPEVVMSNDPAEKSRILKSYYDAIIYRDIIDRYKIKDANLLSTVLRYTIDTYSKPFSSSKIYNYFYSINLRASKKTINSMVKYSESVFLFSQLYKFSPSFKKSFQSRRKLYLTDVGFVKIFSGREEQGRLLEGIVHVELLRRKEKSQTTEIFYLENGKGEVDFVITEGLKPKELIQVTYDLNSNNERREIDPLLFAMEEYGISEGTIVTFSTSGKRKSGNKTINLVPFARWALGI